LDSYRFLRLVNQHWYWGDLQWGSCHEEENKEGTSGGFTKEKTGDRIKKAKSGKDVGSNAHEKEERFALAGKE